MVDYKLQSIIIQDNFNSWDKMKAKPYVRPLCMSPNMNFRTPEA